MTGDRCSCHFQAKQLNNKSKQLEEQDAGLQIGLKALASERAQLSQAQSLLESESAASRQLSAELAAESEALSRQRRGLEAREAELQDRLEACDRAFKVFLLQVILHQVIQLTALHVQHFRFFEPIAE